MRFDLANPLLITNGADDDVARHRSTPPSVLDEVVEDVRLPVSDALHLRDDGDGALSAVSLAEQERAVFVRELSEQLLRLVEQLLPHVDRALGLVPRAVVAADA